MCWVKDPKESMLVNALVSPHLRSCRRAYAFQLNVNRFPPIFHPADEDLRWDQNRFAVPFLFCEFFESLSSAEGSSILADYSQATDTSTTTLFPFLTFESNSKSNMIIFNSTNLEKGGGGPTEITPNHFLSPAD